MLGKLTITMRRFFRSLVPLASPYCLQRICQMMQQECRNILPAHTVQLFFQHDNNVHSMSFASIKNSLWRGTMRLRRLVVDVFVVFIPHFVSPNTFATDQIFVGTDFTAHVHLASLSSSPCPSIFVESADFLLFDVFTDL